MEDETLQDTFSLYSFSDDEGLPPMCPLSPTGSVASQDEVPNPPGLLREESSCSSASSSSRGSLPSSRSPSPARPHLQEPAPPAAKRRRTHRGGRGRGRRGTQAPARLSEQALRKKALYSRSFLQSNDDKPARREKRRRSPSLPRRRRSPSPSRRRRSPSPLRRRQSGAPARRHRPAGETGDFTRSLENRFAALFEMARDSHVAPARLAGLLRASSDAWCHGSENSKTFSETVMYLVEVFYNLLPSAATTGAARAMAGYEAAAYAAQGFYAPVGYPPAPAAAPSAAPSAALPP